MLVATIEFRLTQDANCVAVTLSFGYIYCFFSSQKRLAVQMINFIDDEMSHHEVDMLSIGQQYLVLVDTDNYVIVSSIHRSETNIIITKIFKDRNDYRSMILSSGDFGVSSLYVQGYFALYKTDEETIVVFVVNPNSNTLNLYRAHLDIETFTNTPLKTINNNISLMEVNKFVWKIQCRHQITEGIFDCILISNNYIYDLQIVCVEDAPLSPYMWDVTISYRYYNIFFDELTFFGPSFFIRFTEKYLAVINLSGKRRGIAVYNRFLQSHIIDFFDFFEGESEYRIDHAFSTFFTRDFQSMLILGIDSTENESLYLTQVDLKTTKVCIFNPKRYIGKRFRFYVEFMNNKRIEMYFEIRNSRELNQQTAVSKSVFVMTMEGLLLVLSLVIFVALALLVKIMRDKGSEYMETRTMMTQTHRARVDDILNSGHFSRRSDFNMGEL